MAVPQHTRTFGISDLKAYSLEAGLDTPDAATVLDIPGVRQMEVTITTESEELRGDGAIISVADKGSSLDVSGEMGGGDLDVLGRFLGETASTSGVSPAEVKELSIGATTTRPYVALVGVAEGDSGENFHIFVPRFRMTGDVTLNLQDENFLIPTFEGQGVRRPSDGLLVQLVSYETATAAAIPS